MSIDTQKNVNILPALKEFYFYKMTKKYIPDEKEKYMCAKHKAYFKRRLIDVNFFRKISNFLKKDATIHIASDSKSYISDILFSIHQVKKEFKWVNQNKNEWDYLNMTLPQTKYFQKALKNGFNPIYLKLIKY